MSELMNTETTPLQSDNEQVPPFEPRLFYLLPWILLCWGSNVFVLQGLQSAPFSFWHYFAISSWLGAIYGFTSWVAAWTVLGGGANLLRVALALALLIGMLSASGLGMAFATHFEAGVLFVVVLLCFAQWLLAMAVAAACRYRFRLGIRHLSQQPTVETLSKMQFGIRHIFQLTTLIAVLLALGRAVMPTMPNDNFLHREAWIFAYLSVAAIMITLPMTLAGLLQRYATLSGMIVIGGVVLITVLECWYAINFYKAHEGPDIGHFILINSTSLAWVSLFTYSLRRLGYRVQMIHNG